MKEVKEKQQLVDAVIDQLKKDFEAGDYTVLDELLTILPVQTLIQSLPEEDWKNFDEVKDDDYFQIVHQGYQNDLQREEIQVHCGENGNLFLIKTEEGFIVDVYNQDDNIDTMTVWEEDLFPDEDFDPDEIDIEDFIKKWGQSHEEICANLELETEGSEEYLIVDYFWLPNEKVWLPKLSSMYSEVEQKFADYLRYK